jgi:hypothetical protein
VLHFIDCYAKCHQAQCNYAKCRYAGCRYADCRGAIINVSKIVDLMAQLTIMTCPFKEILTKEKIIFVFLNCSVIAESATGCKRDQHITSPYHAHWAK